MCLDGKVIECPWCSWIRLAWNSLLIESLGWWIWKVKYLTSCLGLLEILTYAYSEFEEFWFRLVDPNETLSGGGRVSNNQECLNENLSYVEVPIGILDLQVKSRRLSNSYYVNERSSILARVFVKGA